MEGLMKRWLLGLLVACLLVAAGLLVAAAEGAVGDLAGGLLCSSGAGLFLVLPLHHLTVRPAAVFRRPTPAQLRAQRLDDAETWHLRPAGLLAYLGLIGGSIALSLWLGRRFPEHKALLFRSP